MKSQHALFILVFFNSTELRHKPIKSLIDMHKYCWWWGSEGYEVLGRQAAGSSHSVFPSFPLSSPCRPGSHVRLYLICRFYHLDKALFNDNLINRRLPEASYP